MVKVSAVKVKIPSGTADQVAEPTGDVGRSDFAPAASIALYASGFDEKSLKALWKSALLWIKNWINNRTPPRVFSTNAMKMICSTRLVGSSAEAKTASRNTRQTQN